MKNADQSKLIGISKTDIVLTFGLQA